MLLLGFFFLFVFIGFVKGFTAQIYSTTCAFFISQSGYWHFSFAADSRWPL